MSIDREITFAYIYLHNLDPKNFRAQTPGSSDGMLQQSSHFW